MNKAKFLHMDDSYMYSFSAEQLWEKQWQYRAAKLIEFILYFIASSQLLMFKILVVDINKNSILHP